MKQSRYLQRVGKGSPSTQNKSQNHRGEALRSQTGLDRILILCMLPVCLSLSSVYLISRSTGCKGNTGLWAAYLHLFQSLKIMMYMVSMRVICERVSTENIKMYRVIAFFYPRFQQLSRKWD